MGIKINKTTEVIKVCPNQEEHCQERVKEFKANLSPGRILDQLNIRFKDSAFCEKCGAGLIEKTIKYENTVCYSCGEAVYPRDYYCPHCGDQLR